MPIRVALAIVATIAGIASPASAAAPVALNDTFGCPSANDARAGNAIWEAKGYDAAWKVVKPKGCRPFPSFGRHLVIYGGDEAKCVVQEGEMGPCLWVPADRIRAE